MLNQSPPRFRIVQARSSWCGPVLLHQATVLWLFNLLAIWQWSGEPAAPGLRDANRRLRVTENEVRGLREKADELRRSTSDLSESD